MWHDSILGTIGNTPLVRLHRVADGVPCTVVAKIEYFNPGASVKDRIGIAMLEDAERKGLISPGGTIIEGTSGNTGAGLALAAIARGYRCIFTTTDKQSPEKMDVLRAMGAEVVVCPTNVAPDDPRSYYSVARRLSQEIPNSFYPNQYDHPANTEAHYHTTGPEIWRDTDGRVTHYVATAGTGGTISGASRYLKEQNPDVKVIGVDPFGSVYFKYFFTREFDQAEIYPYVTEGVGEDILAKNMNFDLVDDYVRVTDRDTMLMTRRLAREEGLFVGQSSGMAVAGALDWLRANRSQISPSDVVVVLLPDSGFRYLSKTYNDEWMRRNGFLTDRPGITAADVLAARRRAEPVVAVGPEATLAEAVGAMMRHSISQVPVIEAGRVVGSLNERLVLDRLVEEPASRERPVVDIMGPPLPVVPRGVHLDHLTAFLDNSEAVLVHADEVGGDGSPPADGSAPVYHIITRSDLISALAQTSAKGRS
jgi:cystathionine beta-synthase